MIKYVIAKNIILNAIYAEDNGIGVEFSTPWGDAYISCFQDGYFISVRGEGFKLPLKWGGNLSSCRLYEFLQEKLGAPSEELVEVITTEV